MSNLFGFFGKNVYRMSTKTNVKPKAIDVFTSSNFVKENIVDKTITTCIKINTMDFYKEESNEAIYSQLIDFLKYSKTTSIDTLYYSMKIALDYQIMDDSGSIIDGGIRYIQVDADEVNVLLDPNPVSAELSYRRAEYLKKKFTISRINGSSYGIMENMPKHIDFKINGITIYANLTDMGSQYYIQNLGPASQDKTFCYGSGTIDSIQSHSVVLFDSRLYGIVFPSQMIDYMPNAINISVEALINQFCYVYDDSEIWSIVESNGGNESDAPSKFVDPSQPGRSPFDPVVVRKPCPGNYPMPPVHPPCHCKPSPFPPHHRPGDNNNSGVQTPINPGDNWNPEDTVVPSPDYNQDHGDVNLEEWCFASEYDDPSIKFVVVDDSISDEDFDATSMVKYSDVLPYISDINIGDYVKKSLVMYY